MEILILGVGTPAPSGTMARLSFWRGLREGLSCVWDTPASLAAMWLAFLVNMTALPLTLGQLPYVAHEIFHVGQAGLGSLVASFALGALTGLVAISFTGGSIHPARMMIVYAGVWYVMLLAFIHVPGITGGRLTLVLAGFAQSLWHGADGGDAAARRRRPVSRPGHGCSHTRDLRLAAGPARRRRPDRAVRLRGHRVRLLRGGIAADRGHRGPLARGLVALGRSRQRALSMIALSGQRFVGPRFNIRRLVSVS
jgi:hypothetical protein